MKQLLSIIFVLIFTFSINAQQSPGKDHSKLNINCKTCHTCDVPTINDPCLVICPRERIATVYQKPEETPETIVIDEISDRYGPVYFSHKVHAQMSDMSGGCEGCHHYNTSGPILKCNSCHEPDRKRDDISLPDLKGALHRQCMDCHREWSHDTGCNSCHQLKKNIKDDKQTDLKNKFKGKEHPEVIEPTKIVYETNTDEGKFATFYHDEHTDLFNIDCTSCHKQESCTNCHDVNKKENEGLKKVKVKQTFEEQHKNCISCHEKDDCSNCHANQQLERFDHKKETGWALGKNHAKLSCARCHGKTMPYKKLSTSCINCHQNWNSENFNHSVTGLQLDEMHADLGCEDCHTENNYSKTYCNDCHDEFAYPNKIPGKLVK